MVSILYEEESSYHVTGARKDCSVLHSRLAVEKVDGHLRKILLIQVCTRLMESHDYLEAAGNIKQA